MESNATLRFLIRIKKSIISLAHFIEFEIQFHGSTTYDHIMCFYIFKILIKALLMWRTV